MASASFLLAYSTAVTADGYHARLRPKGDICPDQAAVLILSAQITAPSPPLPSPREMTGRQPARRCKARAEMG